MPFKTEHPLYGTWKAMRMRCTNKNSPQWDDYGGRGISVCARWQGKEGFRNFVADMGARPNGCTLDRINNDGNYEPSNCKWSTRSEQQHNQTVTRKVTIENIQYAAVELAQKYGFKTDTIVTRASQGLSFAEVISKKKRVFLDGLKLGGIANGAQQKKKTHCPKGHQYTEENTSTSKDGFRRCKTCKRIGQSIINKRNVKK